ncbi:metallophosphoesterase family protein [Paracoccus fistulariae]|uniref:Metallophosphoesterase n=1 Tax=Paracoccus fistulariae TaxID=658446 RepID=A0ABY7SMC6_9RHOB|nr:metallophosphoesterase [Paracoccus fistulariae]MDB6179858.1 metallophosphoesterase [Paracoccus fistulariae]WCR07961.1 metallophosphoesterase [Paracoccus fistulariae]
MTRILHLSDLHFGFERHDLVEPLLDLINRSSADLVVVSGDLTHRGRAGQYRPAADFLARIVAPVMAIPGNHDIPLFNLPARLLWPYRGYRRAISRDLTPVRQSDRIRVFGLNSVDRFAIQRGLLRDRDLAAVTAGIDPLSMNIVAVHHPLEQLPVVDKELARHARRGLATLAEAGVQIVLSGHLHRWDTDQLMALTAHPGVLQIQTGTALCARTGDLQNEVAMLQIDGPHLTVERHIAPMDQPGFLPPVRQRYSRASGVWAALDSD